MLPAPWSLDSSGGLSRLPKFVRSGRRNPPLRKFFILLAGVAFMAGTLAACFGGPPPPPPTDPHDVMVVGDSVAFSFGCVLGESLPGVTDWNCPARPGYSTKNLAVGACTIYPTSVLLYNGGQAGVPNCGTAAACPGNLQHDQPRLFYLSTRD